MKPILTRSCLAMAALACIGAGASSVAAAPITLEGREIAAANSDARANAFNTIVPALTPTAAEKRAAAVTYMDDALALMGMARRHLREEPRTAAVQRMAQSELMAASGKVSTAYLLMFHDKNAAARIRPLAVQLEAATFLCKTRPALAAAVVDHNLPSLAAVYNSELATMGGGAGRGTLRPR